MNNPIKPSLKTEIFSWAIIIIAVSSSFYFYAHFPEQVPVHWNMAGEVDNYGSRAMGAFLFPAIIFFMYLMFLLIPLLDPKKQRYEQFRKVYHIFKNFLLLFMLFIYFAVGLSGMGFNISISTWVPFFVGVLFIIIGNYMGKIKPNWFMGIRTPWTLSSEEVWNKTHRLGGKAFIVAGILMALMNLFPVSAKPFVFTIILIIAALLPIVYSYFLFAKEQKDKQNGKNNNQPPQFKN